MKEIKSEKWWSDFFKKATLEEAHKPLRTKPLTQKEIRERLRTERNFRKKAEIEGVKLK